MQNENKLGVMPIKKLIYINWYHRCVIDYNLHIFPPVVNSI